MGQNKQRIDLEGGAGSRLFPSLSNQPSPKIDLEGPAGSSIFGGQSQPKQGFLRRIFGDPISNATEQAIPGIRAAWSGRQIERPDLEGQVSSIRPMSMLNRLLYPDAYAKTGMFGGIQLNKPLMDRDNQDMNDVLVHEMTHANQGMGGFLRKLYNPSPDEYAAINSEAMRKVRKNDIELRAPR